MATFARTSDETPGRCPVCGLPAAVAPAELGGDGCCASCGGVLRVFRERIVHRAGVAAEKIVLGTPLVGIVGGDELALTEWLLDADNEFDLAVQDQEAERMPPLMTVADVIRFVQRHRRK